MTDVYALKNIGKHDLALARVQNHKAAQLVSKAARTNLPARDDDSHSNFEWHAQDGAFFTETLGTDGNRFDIGLRLLDLTLLVRTQHGEQTLSLDGQTDKAAGEWRDQLLADAGLKQASNITLPYDLPADVASIDQYELNDKTQGMQGISMWFGFASSLLQALEKQHAELVPGPSPVRCWPHHFDIATYVSLESGDAETAKGIGVGFSPGDDSYDQPYFYVNPWPHLDKAKLPPAPAPGHWHTDGFVGLIATAEEILSTSNPENEMMRFLETAFDLGVDGLMAKNY